MNSVSRACIGVVSALDAYGLFQYFDRERGRKRGKGERESKLEKVSGGEREGN